MKRHLLAKGILLAGSLVYSNFGLAAGLGDSNVKSFINQPLRLEINLVDLDTSEITDLQAVITPLQDTAADLQLEPYLVDLEISVLDDGLLVTTQQPMTDPFVNIRIQVDWTSGRLQREYMVLLDPPVFQDNNQVDQNTAVSMPLTASLENEKSVEQSTKLLGTVNPGLTSSDVTFSNNNLTDVYLVQKGDTLWQLALLYRSSRAVSVQQMMLAMLQQNPTAFTDNNINRLLAGQTLRIPTDDEVQRISQALAMAEVKRQNQWLQNGRGTNELNKIAARQISSEDGANNSVNTIDAKSSDAKSSDESAIQQASHNVSEKKLATIEESNLGDNFGSVRLITHQDTTDSLSSGAGDPESKQQKITALTSELALAMENLDRSQRENKALLQDLSLLEQQKETLRRLLELKENQLALLQNLEQIQTSQRQQLALENPASANAEPLPDATTVEQFSNAASDTIISPLNNEADRDLKSIATAAISLYEEFKTWFWGLGLLIILGIVSVLQRRQQTHINDNELDDYDSDDELAMKGSHNPDDKVIVSLASQKEIDSHQWSTELDRAGLDVSNSQDHLEQFANDNAEATTIEQEVSIDDTGIQLPRVEQIIDESQQLIQRGQFARAVEVLSQALEYYQQDVELSLKLMAVAIELQDIDLFNRTERSLPNELDEASLMEIARLYELVTPVDSFADDQKNEGLINQPSRLDNELVADQHDHLVEGNEESESSGDRVDMSVSVENADATVTPPLLDDVIADSATDDDTNSDHGPAQPKAMVGYEADLDPEIAAMLEGMNLDELEADDEFDFLASTDACSTKLDLARAFIDMEDYDGALNLLHEVVEEGDDKQQSIAYKLIKQISDH